MLGACQFQRGDTLLCGGLYPNATAGSSITNAGATCISRRRWGASSGSAKRKRRGGSLGGLERKAAAVIALMEFQTQLRGRLLQHK